MNPRRPAEQTRATRSANEGWSDKRISRPEVTVGKAIAAKQQLHFRILACIMTTVESVGV